MNSSKLNYAHRMLMIHDQDQPAIRVPREAYWEFSSWLDSQLRMMLVRWNVQQRQMSRRSKKARMAVKSLD